MDELALLDRVRGCCRSLYAKIELRLGERRRKLKVGVLMRHGAVDLNVDRRCRVGAIDHAASRGSDDDHNFALGREALRVAGRRVGAEENYCVGLRRVEAAGVKSA